ncbi:MAG: hypothetical protein DMG77_11180 [Acidobacteria bacterium]|nr:MAG: hypothetical protein DMG77_11180 [Acidobacteriota bacterium]
MIRPWAFQLAALCLAVSPGAAAQQPPDDPLANPGRPTVSTPAALTPVGYLQFETGFLNAKHSPEFSSQSSLNEVVKFSPLSWIELLIGSEPFAHSHAQGQSASAAGGISLGTQVVLHAGEGARPTVAVSYFRQIYGGNAPDLDLGSARNSALLLVSAEVKGFHYDTNYLFNEVINLPIHRAQFGQTLSVSHPIWRKLGLSGEIWHFTQPFLRSNAVGNLWALNYNLRRNLVLDAGFNHGFTTTSTRWEVFVGFTYLLPCRILPR